MIVFISDLHLDESRPRIVEQFERFLEEVATGADALYILGDLFEYWVGDDSIALPFPARIAARLKAASARVPISFMQGNRDFVAAAGFSAGTGTRLIDDPTEIDLYGTRTLLLHGDSDGIVTIDFSYDFADALRESGSEVLMEPIEGATHLEVIEPAVVGDLIVTWLLR